MKLLLQVLFAQGWLWRDRFPEPFATARTERRPFRWWFLLFFVPTIWIIVGVAQMADGRVGIGALGFLVAFVWVAWQCSALTIREDVIGKALRISFHWAAGSVIYVLVLLSLAVGISAVEWPLIMWSVVLLAFSASHWLRGVQNNYLIFRDPAGNMWRLEERPREKGLARPYIDLWLDTYWRLPREILFGSRDRATSGGARR